LDVSTSASVVDEPPLYRVTPPGRDIFDDVHSAFDSPDSFDDLRIVADIGEGLNASTCLRVVMSHCLLSPVMKRN